VELRWRHCYLHLGLQCGVNGWTYWANASAISTADPVDAGNVLKVTVDTSLDQHFVNGGTVNQGDTYSISAQVYVPSSNAVLDGISILDSSGGMRTNYDNIATDQWVNIPTSGTAIGNTLSIRGKSGTNFDFQGNGTDVFYVRNVVITETLGDSNYLPAGKYVTQVRRTSDDQVRSFTAVEVSDGTLLAWVNADVDKLDLQTESGGLTGNVTNETATGFDFSVNNEGSTGFKGLLSIANTTTGTYTTTFDVVLNSGSLSEVIIRSGNPPEEAVLVAGANSFTCTPTGIAGIYFRTEGTAVADVSITNITLTQTTADGHVSTWYDQSGNTKHATQATPASQPKIVDAGSLVELGLDFTDGKLLTFSSISAQTVISANQLTDTADFSYLAGRTGSDGGVRTQTGLFLGADTGISGPNDFNNNGGSTYVNGSQSSFDATVKNVYFGTATTGFNLTSISSSFPVLLNRAWKGKIAEIIIYNSDQSDNRTAFEANIGEVYGIAGIPAYDNTVNGFVETWYDQSGNGNNASQLTASQQPKIVDTGVLVTRNGDAAIKSTSDNGMTFTLDSLSADGQQSVFAVLENDVTSQDGFGPVFKVLSTSTNIGGVHRRPWWYVNPTGDLAFTVDSASGYQNSDREYRLYSHVMNDAAGGTSTVHQDGTQVDTRSITLDANATFDEGKVLGVTTNATGALYMSEVIYYPSDESAKRAAIENNIDNHYGITSAGSYVNAAGDSYINAAGDTYLQP